MITGVAIRWGEFIVALPRPARHHDCIEQARRWADADPSTHFSREYWARKSGTQGFTTHDGSFVTRLNAWVHASRCGQLSAEASSGSSRELFSEDLW